MPRADPGARDSLSHQREATSRLTELTFQSGEMDGKQRRDMLSAKRYENWGRGAGGSHGVAQEGLSEETSRHLNKEKERTMWMCGGRTFQAKRTASAKVPKQEMLARSGNKEVGEMKRHRRGA